MRNGCLQGETNTQLLQQVIFIFYIFLLWHFYLFRKKCYGFQIPIGIVTTRFVFLFFTSIRSLVPLGLDNCSFSFESVLFLLKYSVTIILGYLLL